MNTRDLARSDSGVLIKEVPGTTLDTSRPDGQPYSRRHHGTIMTAVRLCPKSEFSSLVFAELGVREKDLEELNVDQGWSKTSPIRFSVYK